jgi:hypothetical protein
MPLSSEIYATRKAVGIRSLVLIGDSTPPHWHSEAVGDLPY